MSEELQALILDDGELADVREAFEALGVRYRDEETTAAEAPLLVTTPRRARAFHANGGPPRHHLHLVVNEPHGELLEGVHCDFLVERPVCAEVLRLLVERAGYEGPERRRMTRVALGVPVEIHTGGRARSGILAQLSIGGCGLVTSLPFDLDADVQLEIPEALVTPRKLELRGRVSSSRPGTTADGTTFDVSVIFEPLSLADRVTVRALMAGQPIDFRPRPDGPATSGGAPKRGTLRRPIAGRSGVARVVIARDLSASGLQIERDPALVQGDRFDLAIYTGIAGSAPLRLRGRVAGDDGDAGFRIAFEDVEEAVRRELAVCCRDLPEATADQPGFVIAEILER